MSVLVGVHGIAKQQLGRHQLIDPWQRALADGIERATGRRHGLPPLDMAFYGDVFLTPSGSGKSGVDPDERLLDDLSDDEVSELMAAAAEVVPVEQDVDDAKAYTKAPLALQPALRALDQRFGPLTGRLYFGELRQVRRYLYDKDIKARVDAAMAAAVGPTCRIIVAHSLGSVVAWEYVRQNPDHPLDLLLTCGSPLGLRMVRSRLPEFDGEAGERPSHVSRWVNLRDPHDPVACAGDLRHWWSGVGEVSVNNQGDAHSALRYLSKREAGEVVVAAAPQLAAL
ncbi:hypothetical protein Lfu02_36420 [Longispora fulva]|uniref:Uncharacterized protein n=1 Tax=Longispora fulva TaxID=619741 RepID=A0A8J7GQK1_9ACTN|nr:hypothetical protein [Longispora fulva]MBG6141577.1 hypothetical protein [Longispora fulva]GIG59270.1 hypothetical protein Lfu02_36420 [Longispora fulva]